MGKRISTEEALRLLGLAEESALVLSPSNTKELAFICCCCGCCCGQLKRLKMLPNPADFFQSYYLARIDPDSCTACGDCMDRCQVDAIKEGETSRFMQGAASYSASTSRCRRAPTLPCRIR